MDIRIMIVDEHTILREGLTALIGAEPGMEVVAQAADGRAAFSEAKLHTPDVVIMGIVMAGLNGIDATRQIAATLPETKIIALSMYSDKPHVTGMLAAGASAYVLKKCHFAELVSAVRAVVEGQTFLSPQVAGIVAEGYMRQEGAEKPVRGRRGPRLDLTAREREVLQLVAEGMSTKQAAATLELSAKTVDMHRQHIMAKLDIHSVAELTKHAIREGISPL